MIRRLEAVLLSSENAKKLADFYQEKVGLKLGSEMEIGDKGEKGYDFELGTGVYLYVMDHDKIEGKNKNPARVMFNLEVDDMDKEVARLKKAEVKVVAETYHVEGYGLITTFEDPDGNYFQFVQVRAS